MGPRGGPRWFEEGPSVQKAKVGYSFESLHKLGLAAPPFIRFDIRHDIRLGTGQTRPWHGHTGFDASPHQATCGCS